MQTVCRRRVVVFFSSLLFSLATFYTSTSFAATHHTGATLGNFSVSSTGAAIYSIKIQVSPGTSGMQPSLSLNYSSQTGNGLLGMGWSLGGLSVIHRCPQTLAQDNQIKAVNFSSTDRFCLDGKRLVAVNGAYGANGTEYRTEIESYSRIYSYGSAGNGPARFKVQTKSGQMISYGNTTDSRIEAQGRADVMTWAIRQINDTAGNYIKFNYTEDNANGHFRINRIVYTGNTNSGTLPYASVRFVYEPRTDKTTGYTAGSKITSPVRLKNVQTYQQETMTRDYRLAYQYGAATGRSRLITLSECAANGECKLSSTFNWQQSTNQTFAPSATHNLPDAYFSGYDTKSKTVKDMGTRVTDINGDGIADLIQLFQPRNGWYGNVVQRRVFLGTGTGYTDSSGFLANLPSTMLFSDNGKDHGVRLVDLNSDGLPDLLQLYNPNIAQGSGFIKAAYLNTGSGFVHSPSFSNSPITSSFGRDGIGYGTRIADLNGDGRPDLIESFRTNSLAHKKKYISIMGHHL